MPFTHVQGNVSYEGTGNVTTYTLTLGAAVGNGNAVVGAVCWWTGTPTVTVADNAANTYTVRTDVSGSTNPAFAMFYQTNITNAPTTITVTFSSAVSYVDLLADEYSGITTFDAATSNTQINPASGADAVTSTTVTTTAAGDLIWGYSANNIGVSSAAGTGFTLRNNNTASGSYFSRSEDHTGGAAGSVAATWSWTGASGRATSGVMAFLSPAGGLSGSLSESTHPSDAPARTMAATRSVTESSHPVDAVSGTLASVSKTLAESTHPADAPAQTLATVTKTLAETTHPADAPARTLATVAKTLAETTHPADAPSGTIVAPGARSLAEAAHPADTVAETLAAAWALAEATHPADAFSGQILGELPMALHTLGTATTNALQTALVFSEALLDSDIAALDAQICTDTYTAQTATVPDSPGPTGTVMTGTTTGSAMVTGVAFVAGATLATIRPGFQVMAQNVPAGTTVTAFSGTTLTMSAPATSAAAGQYFLITPQTPSGGFSRNGLLLVPGRGVLKIRRNDVVAVDNTGWPILVSGASANYQNSNWVFN